jgi:lysophospholipase L1-like esterase
MVLLSLLFLTILTAVLMVRRHGKRGRRLEKYCFVLFFTLLLLEGLSAVVLRWQSGNWLYFTKHNQNELLFKAHPYLVGVNRENVELTLNGVKFSHNSKGFRNAEWGKKTPAKMRIAAIGGSTTYGVGVNDWETWPYYLDSLMGEEVEVLNLGIPGHSTVEHLVFAVLWLKEIEADVVILHTGLNDLRNANIKDLKSDYSNFHAPSLRSSLGLCPDEQLPKVAFLRMCIVAMQTLNWYPSCNVKAVMQGNASSNEIDVRLTLYFQEHLNSLVKLLNAEGIRVLLLPQVLIEEGFYNGNYQWWAPFLSDEIIVPFSDTLNGIMNQIAINQDVTYLKVDTIQWNINQFADPSHLNAVGNKTLAFAIGKQLLEMKEEEVVEEVND